MSSYIIQVEDKNILSRFKAFDRTHHFHKLVYQNPGTLKDAERFSLVDPVLDGEYNDFAVVETSRKTSRNTYWKSSPKILAYVKKIGARILFRSLSLTLFLTYFIGHSRYKAL